MFDCAALMPEYNELEAHASTALNSIPQTKDFASEPIIKAFELSHMHKNTHNVRDKILIVTNEHILYIKSLNKLK